MIYRRLAPALLATALLMGCASSSKLSQKSEEKLAGGDAWKAWQLATRALDKEPGNPRARSAATAAGASIALDWQRRIRALAETDSMKAAAEVLELTAFREDAARYATIPVGAGWPAEEQSLRQMAARFHYGLARAIRDMVARIRVTNAALNTVALSGGCFQNKLLLEELVRLLKADGLSCLFHAKVPSNDGGLALGQAAIAAARHIEVARASCA